MPFGPVDVRNGLKPSSCTAPGENRRCFRGQPSGEGVLWQADEGACWPAWAVAEQSNRAPKVLGGIALYCEPGYLSDPDDTSRGCFDAWGRRYQWDGGAWREQKLEDRFSGWWLGICPPRAPKVCPSVPTPPPSDPKPQPACYAGPWRMECRFESCEIQGVPQNSVFSGAVRAALAKLLPSGKRVAPEAETEAFVALLRDELKAQGYCAAYRGDDRRISHDEIAVWSPGNPLKEHIDVAVADGQGRETIDAGVAFMVARGIP